MDDLIYVWTDGTTCTRDHLSEMVVQKGDDYEVMTQQEYFDLNPEEV